MPTGQCASLQKTLSERIVRINNYGQLNKKQINNKPETPEKSGGNTT
jgi:hypothetical protein